jgi:hypothetical protein
MTPHSSDSIKQLNANCIPKSNRKIQRPPILYDKVDLSKRVPPSTVNDDYVEMLIQQQYN